MHRLFIAGTDTNVGKTYVATSLLHYYAHRGWTTLGIKPLATGATMTADGLRNEDATALQAASTMKLPYEMINPYVFELPVAPTIAADCVGATLSSTQLLYSCESALATNPDLLIIEGVGGWAVPLNAEETMADFVALLKASVLLVVGMRLGCLNHAILTVQSMRARGITCVGWVANTIDCVAMEAYSANVVLLAQCLPIPYLGQILYQMPVNIDLNIVYEKTATT